jgi:hypothetical protein
MFNFMIIECLMRKFCLIHLFTADVDIRLREATARHGEETAVPPSGTRTLGKKLKTEMLKR